MFANTATTGARAAEDLPLHEWGKHSDEDLYEGAITIEAQDGTRKVAKVLGGPLGKETIDGIGQVSCNLLHPRAVWIDSNASDVDASRP